MRIAALLIVVIFWFAASAVASPAKITSGELFIGGSAFGTADYQTYLRYRIVARSLTPRRVYLLDAEQVWSVFQNFPSRPAGAFDFSLATPYGPQRLLIDGELFSPVWHADSVWKFSSDIVTPEPTPTSPQTVHLQAPFTMAGSTALYGAFKAGFRIRGGGTLDVLFERVNSKYFVREARFLFGDSAPASNP